jgi:hypothetical protein
VVGKREELGKNRTVGGGGRRGCCKKEEENSRFNINK